HDRRLDEALGVICINQYADKTFCQISAPPQSSMAHPSQVQISPSRPIPFLCPPPSSSLRKNRKDACPLFERHPEHADDDSPGTAQRTHAHSCKPGAAAP